MNEGKMNIKNNLIKDKSYNFALEIIKLVQILPRNIAGIELGKQLIRSGTSIGANVEEAIGAFSRKDFIHMMNISKKEARESRYWLRLMLDSQLSSKISANKLLDDANELTKILTAIVKTAKIRS